jgi:uncharacterized protein (DUF1697 family)
MTGHNSLNMTELSVLYNSLGFTGIQTYIQSGNVIFGAKSEIPVHEITQRIEKEILIRFNLVIPTMIRTSQEVSLLPNRNPFLNEKKFDPVKMAVIFLHESPSDSQIDKVLNVNYPPDKFYISGPEIFIYCPNGFGKTKIYTNFFEKKMSVAGTARNWKTITAILQMAEKQ